MNEMLRRRLWKALGEKISFPHHLSKPKDDNLREFVTNKYGLQEAFLFTPERIPKYKPFFDKYLRKILPYYYNNEDKLYWKLLNEELQERGSSGFLAEQELSVFERLENYDVKALSYNQKGHYLRLMQIWLLYPELICDEKRVNTTVYRFLEK